MGGSAYPASRDAADSSRMMKILIDHGAYDNFGDLAMLQAAVERISGIDGVELQVQISPISWRRENVQPVEYHVPLPVWGANRVLKSRLIPDPVRRRLASIVREWRYRSFDRIGRGAGVGAHPVVTSAGLQSIESWCKQYDALFIAGGGDMNDVFPQALWRCCSLVHAFAEQRKPVLLSGQQLGPIRRAESSRLLASALRSATFVGVREPTDSLDILSDAGIQRDRIDMIGDDSLGIVPADRAEVDTLLARHGISAGRFIAVNVRMGPYTPVQDRHLRDLAELLARLSSMSALPLLAVRISVAEDDSDLASARQLSGALGGGSLTILDREPLSVALVKGVLGRAHGAIGMSYHFCTFALSQGVPAVAIHLGDYYDQKARGLAAFWGDDRLAMSIASLGGAAARPVHEVFSDASLRERLQQRAGEASRIWENGFCAHFVRRLEVLASPPGRGGIAGY